MAILGAAIIGCAMAVRFHKKIEETIAPGALILMLVMYICGRWFSIMPGFVIALGVVGLALVYCLYKFISDRALVCSSVFTWGGLAFLIYLLFFAYYAFHRDFSHPDELYCWGLMAREYYMYHDMFSSLATSMSGDAPPLMPLWNCLSSMMWFRFSDSICYFGQNMFVISLMLPVFAHIRKKDFGIADFSITMSILPLILVLSGMDGFKYIICDMLLAAELCFFMTSAISFLKTTDYYYYFSMLLSVFAFCLTKRSGVLFAGVAIMIVTGVFMNESYRHIRELVCLTLLAVLSTFSWYGMDRYMFIPIVMFLLAMIIYFALRRHGDVSDRFRPYVTGVYICIVAVCTAVYIFRILIEDAYGYDVMARFMKDLFSISVGGEDTTGYICLSYGFFILISLFAAVLISRTGCTSFYVRLFCDMGIGLILYAFVMLYAHIMDIGPVNNHRESLFPRYMIPWEILVVFMLVYVFVIEREQTSTVVMMVALVIILTVSDSGTLLQGLFAKHRCIGFTAFDDAGVILGPDDMVYYIDEQPYFNYSDREFYNHIAPAKSNFIDQIFFGNNGRIQMNCEELAMDMADDRYLHVPYDYLYLQSFDDDFADRYGILFENPSEIEAGRVYQITIDGNDLKIKTVN